MTIVKGQEVVERIQGPEKMSTTQIGDFLCLGKANRSGLRPLLDLVPRPETSSPPVNSAWTLLTNDDVEFQLESMENLSEQLIDNERMKEHILNALPGTYAQKMGDIEKTKEVMRLVIEEVNKTDLNKAMHGKFMERCWDVMESMLPGKYNYYIEHKNISCMLI
ncbi:uncharacterized protein LOC111132393 [Crassostrea virginica]